MLTIKKNIIAALGLMLVFSSCDNDFEEINIDPNNPEVVPTYTVFADANRRLMNQTRDGWASGRMLLPWVQYSAQLNYINEDKYQYRASTGDQVWDDAYRAAANFKRIIELCNELPGDMVLYGNLDNQIAISRILLSYTFLTLTNHFGDVPYWSYGGMNNAEFQALQIDDYPQPTYLSQSVIFEDILNELKEASAMINEGEIAMSNDVIYGGDAMKWKKFANSLRLRVANQIKDVYPAATMHINEAIAGGIFTSNADNAVLSYGSSSVDGSPFWAAFFVDNRTDFGVNKQFVDFLKGSSGNFGVDPRLQKMLAPKGTLLESIGNASYLESSDLNDYEGMPYALPKASWAEFNNSNASLFSSNILKPDYKEVYMEYAEVEFILSEINGWDQAHYENAVRASMEKWEVATADIDDFIASLPAANEENVLTQKWASLFMQPQVAWTEIRRTGYPNGNVLLLPGGTAKAISPNGVEEVYTFEPLPSDSKTHIPYRIKYPIGEQSLNANSWKEAVADLSNGDALNSKLWWMP